MKAQQIQQLEDLSKCWIEPWERMNIAGYIKIAEWGMRLKPESGKHLRRLWNRYRNQIRHNNKNKEK